MRCFILNLPSTPGLKLYLWGDVIRSTHKLPLQVTIYTYSIYNSDYRRTCTQIEPNVE